MSREVKEKPRGKNGAIQKGKNAAMELGRRHASETAARAREQTKIEQARQEQPEDYANEQVEDGAAHGAVLAEQVVRSGTKKRANAGRRDRAGVYERGDPLEKEKTAPDVKERTSEPGDRIREKPAQSERVSAESARPVKQRERQTRTPLSAETSGKIRVSADEHDRLERPRGLNDSAATEGSGHKPVRGSDTVEYGRKERASEPEDRIREKPLQSERVSAESARPVKQRERHTQPSPSAETSGKVRLSTDGHDRLERRKGLSDSTAAGGSGRKPARVSGVVSAETGHTETDASVSHGLQKAIPTDAYRAPTVRTAPQDVRQPAACIESKAAAERKTQTPADVRRTGNLPTAPTVRETTQHAEPRSASQPAPYGKSTGGERVIIKEKGSIAGGGVKTRHTGATERAKGMAVRSVRESRGAAKTAKKGAQGAKQAAKAGAKAARALKETVKAAAASLRAMVGTLASGGGVVFLVVLVICLVAMLLATPFGLFFSADSRGSAGSVQSAVTSINGEFCMVIEQIQEEHPCDEVVLDDDAIAAVINNWDGVLAIYAVLVTTDGSSPTEAVTMTQEKLDVLRGVFWDMTQISYSIATTEETDEEESTSTMTISITIKTKEQMAAEYGFTAEQMELLAEMTQPEYASLFAEIKGSDACLKLSPQQVAEIVKQLPADLSEERRQVVLTAYRLLGRVNYFWGGKSLCLGWDSRWGAPYTVTAAGDSTSGTMRPYGLDCSGFVDWVFYNVSEGTHVLGHGGGASAQHSYCIPITWEAARPGDLAFYPGDSHVGIICGFDETGAVQIIHCAKSANNVVITGKSGFTSVGRPIYYSG